MDLKSFRKLIRLALTPMVMLATHLLVNLINPNAALRLGDNITWQELLSELGISFAFSWLIIECSIWIAYRLEIILPWSKNAFLRFSVQTLVLLLSTSLLLYIENQVYYLMYPGTWTDQERLEVWQFGIITLIVTFMVSALHTGWFLLNRWKNTLEEAAELKVKTLELKEVALQAELQSLKLQLDPHFLFNNFSTLSELIYEDTVKASLFLDKLSKVYRYMIQNVKQDVVLLQDEIRFLKAYLYLIHIRHGRQVQVTIDIDQALQSRKWIPPLTLQLLIENAIKHNRATHLEPLKIQIYFMGERLCVSNNLQPFAKPLPSTKIGLENIKNRYRILSNDVPHQGQSSTIFWVEVPLFNSIK